MYHWKKGISLSFFENEKRETWEDCQTILKKVKDCGFDCVELSFSHDDYFENYHFTEEKTAREFGAYCRSLGLLPWSIHLPFSEKWDLSRDDAIEALRDDIELIKAAHEAGISVAVIHPSFEPVATEERGRRIANAIRNLKTLAAAAEKNEMILGLENLPRTCLGNASGELADLLDATGASFVFDTNHSLSEDNVSFLQNMLRRGYCPVSLHLSDYDGEDERHDLPGRGINPWSTLLDLLQTAAYSGPALYEIRRTVSPGRTVSLAELTTNINALLNGEIS